MYIYIYIYMKRACEKDQRVITCRPPFAPSFFGL